MPQSLSQILLHIVYSTKNRAPFLDRGVAPRMHAYLATVSRACGSPAVRVGGTTDHVHLLCRLSRTTRLCDIVEEIKKRSSHWVKGLGARYRDFSWQAGYGAFSIGESQREAVERYINEQEEHHRVRTFKEEFLAFLKKYNIEYDERYVWD